MAEYRPGNKALETVLKTDELYGHDELFLGQRGQRLGEMLPDPKPYQIANLYPDPNSSYWLAFLDMPEGSVLELRGVPRSRYFQYTLYGSDPDMGGYTATGENLLDNHIEPDPGSANPFVPGTNRKGDNRDYTVRIANVEAPADPADRAPNTMYAGVGNQIQIVYRVYLPDPGYLGDAGVGMPAYSATPRGRHRALRRRGARARYNRPLLRGCGAGRPVDRWVALCTAPDNDPELRPDHPGTQPGHARALLQQQRGTWSGVFKPWEERLRQLPRQGRDRLRRRPGHVVHDGLRVAGVRAGDGHRGKDAAVPRHLLRQRRSGLDVIEDWESRYWSLILSQAPPSGIGMDALSDFQVPLDGERNYTIVVCRPDDRPANATEENGVAWMDWGIEGEGIDHPSSRSDFGLLVFRYMYNNPNWEHNPSKIEKPGTEADVMGPYFPRISYTDRATFEAKG